MIKAIIFDFAGVIGTDGYWIWLGEIVPNLDQKKEYFSAIADKVDKGIITNSEFTKLLSMKLGIPQNQIWEQESMRIIINTKVVNLIRILKKHYKIGLLTNFTHEWMTDLLKKNRLKQLFDAILISSLHGVIKPEPAAYNKMLEFLSIRKEEAVFIDDREIHVVGAKKIGLTAILYKNERQLRSDLITLGITIG